MLGWCGYYNKEWVEKMEGIGLMLFDIGKEGGCKVGEKMVDYLILGGVFMVVVEVLLMMDFKIIWCDCFLVKV